MSDGRRRIDRILDEDFLGGLQDRAMSELRAMRADAKEEEALLSYERRMLHGRLDLLRFELERRAGGAEGSLVDNLSKALGGERRASRGSFPGDDPDLEAFGEPSRRISKMLADDTLALLPTLSDDEVRERITESEEAERELSETRSRVLSVLDALNEEVGRRYAAGEADPDEVLRAARDGTQRPPFDPPAGV
jgi:hypothetical protein